MINCPKCFSEMEITSFKEIEVDRCTNCKGLWFQPEELAALRPRGPPSMRGQDCHPAELPRTEPAPPARMIRNLVSQSSKSRGKHCWLDYSNIRQDRIDDCAYPRATLAFAVRNPWTAVS